MKKEQEQLYMINLCLEFGSIIEKIEYDPEDLSVIMVLRSVDRELVDRLVRYLLTFDHSCKSISDSYNIDQQLELMPIKHDPREYLRGVQIPLEKIIELG